MLEIYNEEYKDLLGKGPPAGAHPLQSGTCALTFLVSIHYFPAVPKTCL